MPVIMLVYRNAVFYFFIVETYLLTGRFSFEFAVFAGFVFLSCGFYPSFFACRHQFVGFGGQIRAAVNALYLAPIVKLNLAMLLKCFRLIYVYVVSRFFRVTVYIIFRKLTKNGHVSPCFYCFIRSCLQINSTYLSII